MRLLVVDTNWYLHRVYYTLRTNRPIEEVLPYNLVSLVLKDALHVRATHIELAVDGPEVFRYDVYDGYKAARQEKKDEIKKEKDKKKLKAGDYKSEKRDEIYSYLPAVFKYLDRIGIKFIQPQQYEADDVLRTRAAQYGKKHKVILGTKDKDNFQSLSDNVQMFDSTFKNKLGEAAPRYVTKEMAEAQKGCLVEQMVDYQTLLGDAIDSVPQILSPAKVKKALSEYGTISNWYKEGSAEDRKWLKRNQEDLKRNKKLVQLVSDCVPKEEEQAFVIPKQKIEDMPKSWYSYQDFLYPKTKGLFNRR